MSRTTYTIYTNGVASKRHACRRPRAGGCGTIVHARSCQPRGGCHETRAPTEGIRFPRTTGWRRGDRRSDELNPVITNTPQSVAQVKSRARLRETDIPLVAVNAVAAAVDPSQLVARQQWQTPESPVGDLTGFVPVLPSPDVPSARIPGPDEDDFAARAATVRDR